MASNSKKLCYILPEYDEKTATHFAHIYYFLEEISKYFDLYVIAERGRIATRKSLRGAERRSNLQGGLFNRLLRGVYPERSRRTRNDEMKIASLPVVARNDERRAFRRSYVLSFSFFPLRILETLVMLLKLRMAGYQDFYVHYSFLSAFLASIIVRIFGGRVYYWNCGEPWKYKRNILREAFEKFTYKLITYLITGTESLKKEYAKHYGLPPEKIKVMPNWIDIRGFRVQGLGDRVGELKKKLNIGEDKKIIFFIHRLSRRKGAHYLPEIIKAFRDEKVVFVIIGDGPERENLELRIKNYELGKKVRLLGWLPNKELPFYYSIADIFLMPSEEEGFPRVLLEAMAMKVPFVASDVGGVREIIPKIFQEYLCGTGDTECLVLKIKKLLFLRDEELHELKKAEYDRAVFFSMEKAAECFKELFV